MVYYIFFIYYLLFIKVILIHYKNYNINNYYKIMDYLAWTTVLIIFI
jgi:hypothetical protein